MPCLRILSNLPKSEIPNDFADNIVLFLAQVYKKDAKRCHVVISPDCQLSVGGESALPSAVATLESISRFGPEYNKDTAKQVSQFVHKQLGIHPDRFFLSFYGHTADTMSKGGATLAA